MSTLFTRQGYGAISGTLLYNQSATVGDGNFGAAITITAGAHDETISSIVATVLSQNSGTPSTARFCIIQGSCPNDISQYAAITPGQHQPLNASQYLPGIVMYDVAFNFLVNATVGAGVGTYNIRFLEGEGPALAAGQTYTCILVPLINISAAPNTNNNTFLTLNVFGGPMKRASTPWDRTMRSLPNELV